MDWTFLLHLFLCLRENIVIVSSQTRLIWVARGMDYCLSSNFIFVLLFVFNWSANLSEISWVNWQQHLPRIWSFLTPTSSENAAPSSQLELKKWQQQNLLHGPKGSFSSANTQWGSDSLNGEKKYAGKRERENAVLSWMVWYSEGEYYSWSPKTTALILLFYFSLFPAQSRRSFYTIFIPILLLWPKVLFLFVFCFQ